MENQLPVLGDRYRYLNMLDAYWVRNFEQAPLLAHELRDRFRQRWVRFHSLPKGKRYAETDAEWVHLLKRHNTVISQLAVDGRELTVLTTNWSSSPELIEAPNEIRGLGLAADHLHSFTPYDERDNWWHVFHTSLRWCNGILDPVLRLVANHDISNVMIVDVTADWLVHPYDGGIDLILPTRVERDSITNQFRAWKSERSDGL